MIEPRKIVIRDAKGVTARYGADAIEVLVTSAAGLSESHEITFGRDVWLRMVDAVMLLFGLGRPHLVMRSNENAVWLVGNDGRRVLVDIPLSVGSSCQHTFSVRQAKALVKDILWQIELVTSCSRPN